MLSFLTLFLFFLWKLTVSLRAISFTSTPSILQRNCFFQTTVCTECICQQCSHVIKRPEIYQVTKISIHFSLMSLQAGCDSTELGWAWLQVAMHSNQFYMSLRSPWTSCLERVLLMQESKSNHTDTCKALLTVTFTHVLLIKPSYMTKFNVNEMGKYSPPSTEAAKSHGKWRKIPHSLTGSQ